LALVVALVASFFLYKWTKKKVTTEVAEEKEVKILKVAVAKVRLPAGTKIKRDAIGMSSFLETSLPSGYHTDLQKLEGRVVLTPMQENELILESRLAPVSVKVGGVSALIEPGKRAVTVKGGNVLGVAGFVLPGNHVDIMMKTVDPKTGEQTNKIIFENMRVLATGTRLSVAQQGKGKKGRASPTGTYTFEVTPEEAERLVLAAKSGPLQFALRNPADNETVLTTGATMRETYAQYRPVVSTDRSKQPEVKRRVGVGRAPVRAAPAKVTHRRFTLEVIRGLDRTVEQY
jgi:pilus assembly protein CpaB